MDSTVLASDPAGRPAPSRLFTLARAVLSGCLSMTLLGQSPLHLIEGRAPLMPPCPKPPALFLLGQPCPSPRGLSLFPFLLLPWGDKWQQGSGSQYLQAA